MRFGDISKSVLIILIFVLLYFSTILTSGIQKIKDDWPQYRCLPTYMPLAGYVGKTQYRILHIVLEIFKKI